MTTMIAINAAVKSSCEGRREGWVEGNVYAIYTVYIYQSEVRMQMVEDDEHVVDSCGGMEGKSGRNISV